MATLKGHNDAVRSVSFSPDGSLLASGSYDKTIKLWDVKSGTNIATLKGHNDAVHSVSFSPDGSLLASGSGGYFFSGSVDNTVKLWDVKSYKKIATLEGHTDCVESVAFSPDGSLLASGSWDETVKLWDVKSRTNITTLEGYINWVNSVAFSPDGNLLASGSNDSRIKLWDVKSRTNIATLEGHTGSVNSVAFSPDGTMLASGSDDETVKLWDVKSKTNIATLSGHTSYVKSVAFSPDGSLLASGSWDKTVKLWDVKSRASIATLWHGAYVKSVAFSPDGTLLASVGSDWDIELWDIKSGEHVDTLRGSSSFAFSPDGTLLASGSTHDITTVELRDIKTKSIIATLSGHTYDVKSVAFNPDGNLLASGSGDETVKLWDVKSRTNIATLVGHNYPIQSVAFSPDGSLLASGSYDGAIILWDMKPYIGQAQQQPNIVVSNKSYKLNDTPITTHSDWTFSISNTGNSDLKISVIDSDNPAFTVAPMAFPQSVAPGKALDVAVSFTPTDEKTYTGILTIKSNDPDSPTITISLEGNGIKNPKAMQYYISSPSNENDRGGLIIPSDTFPEGKGSIIPIYIPSIVDGSNKIIEDTAWKTVKEINKAKLNFEWEEMIANLKLESADTQLGALMSATAGLINAANKVISISVCNIIIQKDSGGNFRAIIQVGDLDRRTFIRKYAGEGAIDPLADSFWLVQATFSDQIAKTFSLEPDSYPNVFYTMTINIDTLHKDDSYIGYLSLSDKGKIVMTPKVYPKDELKIIRFHQFIIPYKKETVLALSGDGFLNFMEGSAEPGFIKMLTPSLSESAIVVQGHSPIEIRVYDSQSRVTGLVKGEIKEDIPESIYDESHKIVIILSPTDVYRYEIVGTDNGEYGLEVTSIKEKESNTFTATDVPTSPNAVHEYSVDWNALSKDKGVTINIDSNGDGKIDETVNSGVSFIGYNCDVNSDGVVNILDLVIVVKSFGKDVNNAKADVNKDGIVDVLDLNIVGQHLGEVYK
ncbi:MAG: choice-of-anchor D domain-containing protein [Candidatus Taylorbacteria bacterium]|nr:choice-of-anchor D domain-containing protein [Candidatus Taylorbacteria bacterium]